MYAKWFSYFCGAVLVISGLFFLLFVPELFRTFEREPEDLVLIMAWGACLLAVAALCFWNGKTTSDGGSEGGVVHIALNGIVVLLSVALPAVTADPVGQFIIWCILPSPVIWLVRRFML